MLERTAVIIAALLCKVRLVRHQVKEVFPIGLIAWDLSSRLTALLLLDMAAPSRRLWSLAQVLQYAYLLSAILVGI